MTNPLISDRDVEFILYEVHDTAALTELDAFADHSRETFDMYFGSCRRLAREALWPTYRAMDEAPPVLEDGRVRVHPSMKELWPMMTELGLLTASRPYDVGGAQLPLTVSTLASGYLMAGNLCVYGYAGLTIGAARLIESFGTDALKEQFMVPMYDGRWSGTMALTEPQAGSSLSDVMTKAIPNEDGTYSLTGQKVFLSGGDQDFTENIVHLTLARIEGAAAGTRGISLFAVPRLRPEDGKLVDNDANPSGLFHKIGWKGLPSIALSMGDKENCKGWLVGEPNHGLKYMFQMMNEARLMVGMNAVATASAAYHESLAYAKDRPQGRKIGAKDPTSPQIPIIEHADVRRMLMRQKAIVEGSLALLATCARYADLEEHAAEDAARAHAHRMLELLIPVAKSFPAERGFESNALAVQIHGGYGYTTEYLPESWMRDQKLNSIHEGTTGIHSLDLLGRKVVAEGGAALEAMRVEVDATVKRARAAKVESRWCDDLQDKLQTIAETTMVLASQGMRGDVEAMTRHSADFLDMFSTFVIAWQWLSMAAAAQEKPSAPFYEGKIKTAQYWFVTELPRIDQLARLCVEGDDSYTSIDVEGF